jgi:ClpP class serine protease
VVPVEGTLVRRTGGMDAESGLQSYDALSATLRQLAGDPAVDGIVLAIDSPAARSRGWPTRPR